MSRTPHSGLPARRLASKSALLGEGELVVLHHGEVARRIAA